MSNLIPKIMGWLVVIITLALAPSIATANATITTTLASANEVAHMVGMTTIDDFGAPIMIIGLLFSGGLMGIAGVKGKLAGASVGDMMGVIGSVITTIIALTFFDTALDYVNTLISAGFGSTFAQVIYGVIPIVMYVAIIAGAGVYTAYKTYKLGKGKKSKAAANY